MNQKLIKMRVQSGFDCQLKLQTIYYEDDVTQGGEVYKFINKNRNDKNKIKLNEIWMTYNISNNTPFWSSYVIIKQDNDKTFVINKIKELYSTVIDLLNKTKDEFIKNIETLKPLTDDEAVNKFNELQEQFNKIVFIKKEQLFNDLSKMVKEKINQKIIEQKLNVNNIDMIVDCFLSNSRDDFYYLMDTASFINKQGDYLQFDNDKIKGTVMNEISDKFVIDFMEKFKYLLG